MRTARSKAFAALMLASALASATAAQAQGTAGGTLDRIRADNTLRIAYREDAAPFSYKDKLGEPAGYMIDLCRGIAVRLKTQLNLPTMSVTYVPVTVQNRFDVIQQGKADLLCDSTSATLARRELVDFSIATYIDGAGLMIRRDGPKDMQSMGGRKIGVLAGTTTEQVLRKYLKDSGATVDVVPAKSYTEGLAMLDSGEVTAYFGDRSILESLIGQSKAPANLLIANDYLTIEPYALAMMHGDEAFRLAVDTALSHIYRSGEINPIFDHSFAGRERAGPVIQALYLISGLPD